MKVNFVVKYDIGITFASLKLCIYLTQTRKYWHFINAKCQFFEAKENKLELADKKTKITIGDIIN